MTEYSIGVVTYLKRFEQYFKPLVFSLEKIFPKKEKIFVLNGFYDQVQQAQYLKRAKEFLSKYPKVKVIAYNKHQSLSKCWNQIIINSSSQKTLILNDDLEINKLFRLSLNLQIGFYNTAVINRSWSHFIISKETIKKTGWFDERFLGMGSEDADYALRLALSEGKTYMPHSYLHNIYALGVKNIIANDQDPGWKNISGFSQGKYAQVNYDFFHKKWNVIKEPKIGYVHGFNAAYYQIRPGMETPMFYSISELDKTPKI